MCNDTWGKNLTSGLTDREDGWGSFWDPKAELLFINPEFLFTEAGFLYPEAGFLFTVPRPQFLYTDERMFYPEAEF